MAIRHMDKEGNRDVEIWRGRIVIGTPEMKVELVAFDSMGARSMCTYIETEDVRITIDPAVALAEKRFNLGPHAKEVERMGQLAERIRKRATESDIIVITHYHYDHHDPGDTVPLDIYSGKTILTKDPKNRINSSQGNYRAPLFLAMIKGRAKKVEVADGRRFSFGGTEVEFSDAVCHGADSAMGYVIQTMVRKGEEKVVHTSDVQGPSRQDQADFILTHRPQTAIIDGPMLYMLGYAYSQEDLEASLGNLRAMLSGGTKKIVLDHHFARDLTFGKYLDELRAEFMDAKIGTAAEFMGMEDDLLEARRRELHKGL